MTITYFGFTEKQTNDLKMLWAGEIHQLDIIKTLHKEMLNIANFSKYYYFSNVG